MIAAGTRLGSYELLAQIGAGGMGEVYKAHDTKLGRDVAIKILPEAFAHDAERLARFQREAKMLAALNHPNIATIHGLEQSNGTQYLVMELVSGDTLAERIKREGAVPVEEALKIAVQITEALEAAHEKGIIHRDLKPANVKVTPEGKVKVLDFGLAKAFAGDAANDNPSNSPTLSMAATMHGVILGTAAYMSPEQARGKAVDKRTDIWALGCVLYEMLTGKQAFNGEDITEILAAVVKTDPDWNRLPESTPSSIRLLLHRCLQKDKTLRLRDSGDACIEIQEALTTPALADPRNVAGSRRDVWQLPVFVGLAAVVAAAVAGVAVWNLKPVPATTPRPVTRSVITLPPGEQLAAFDYPAIALSPDGSQLAYVAVRSGTRQIYLRSLDSLEARPLVGTEGANTPFFSPDGQWLGFFAGGSLKKISLNGGAALNLVNGPTPRGATWTTSGTIVFTPNGSSALQQISEAGGTPQPMTRLDKGEVSHRDAELLPSGKAVLFDTTGANPRIAVQSLVSGQRRDLVPGGRSPHFAPSGHLVYVQGANLMAVPFDPQRLQITGAAVPVVQGVLRSPVTGGDQYSISATGSLAYVSGTAQSTQTLTWVSRNGAEQPLAAAGHVYIYPRLSPDGRRVAVTIAEQEGQVWLYDLARETLSRFTFEGNLNQIPVWAPDGKHIAFYSTKEGPQNLYWQLADGSGGLERLMTSDYTDIPRSFSPDGQLLAFAEINPTTGFDIWVLRLSDHKAQPFLRTHFNESAPTFSPDGHWLAYISDESGRYEVYVQPYPGSGGKWQISTEGGTEPVWNPKGGELFYRSGSKMMAVDIITQPNFSAGKPRMLFEGSYLFTPATMPYYDVSADGQRFLMIKPNEQSSSSSPLNQLVVVHNWFEELKQRVPTEKR
jgi:eukaryotic-like serine/threonine-protein kinase